MPEPKDGIVLNNKLAMFPSEKKLNIPEHRARFNVHRNQVQIVPQ